MPFTIILLLFPKKIQHTIMHYLVSGMSWAWFTIIGIKCKFYNTHFLNNKEGAVIIANHATYMDAPMLYRAINEKFKTLGKVEIAKVPLFGLIYKITCVTVDRSSVTSRGKSFIQMKNTMDNGTNIAIFPEGTFDDNPKENASLLPFQEGAFKLACISGKRVLPILFLDARKRMHPSNLFKCTPGRCRIVYLPPIYVTADTDSKLLKDYCFNYMNAVWQKAQTGETENLLAFANNYLTQNPFIA